MATYGHTFTSGDTVTPTKLNNARTVSDIVNADISATAAIAATKLASDSITNTQIKSDAAIAGTKIAPNFGSQNITTTGSIGLNGATPGVASFASVSDSLAGPQLNLTNNFNGNTSYCPFIVLSKQRGSGAVSSGDRIAQILFRGHDGTQLQTVAGINASAEGSVSTGVVPGRLAFATASSAGTETERMRITSGGEVGIGTTTPSSRALLDLTSTTKGFLPPRMTTAQRDAISTPPAGLVIYNTSTNVLNFYNGSAWAAV